MKIFQLGLIAGYFSGAAFWLIGFVFFLRTEKKYRQAISSLRTQLAETNAKNIQLMYAIRKDDMEIIQE